MEQKNLELPTVEDKGEEGLTPVGFRGLKKKRSPQEMFLVFTA